MYILMIEKTSSANGFDIGQGEEWREWKRRGGEKRREER